MADAADVGTPAVEGLPRDALCARRPHMADKPLIIVLFEGVLGDVFKQQIFDRDPLIPLYVRPGMVQALKALVASYQVVLITYLPRTHVTVFCQFLVESGVRLDALFDRYDLMSRPMGADTQAYLQDYAKIYLEFGISSDEVSKRVLIISSLALDRAEIDAREADRLVHEPSSGIPYFVPAVPLPFGGSGTDTPVVLAVPNPRCDLNFEALPADAILRVLRDMARVGSAGWRRGFAQLQRVDVKRVETDVFTRRPTRWNQQLSDRSEVCVHRFAVLVPSKCGAGAPYIRAVGFGIPAPDVCASILCRTVPSTGPSGGLGSAEGVATVPVSASVLPSGPTPVAAGSEDEKRGFKGVFRRVTPAPRDAVDK